MLHVNWLEAPSAGSWGSWAGKGYAEVSQLHGSSSVRKWEKISEGFQCLLASAFCNNRLLSDSFSPTYKSGRQREDKHQNSIQHWVSGTHMIWKQTHALTGIRDKLYPPMQGCKLDASETDNSLATLICPPQNARCNLRQNNIVRKPRKHTQSMVAWVAEYLHDASPSRGITTSQIPVVLQSDLSSLFDCPNMLPWWSNCSFSNSRISCSWIDVLRLDASVEWNHSRPNCKSGKQ